VHNPSFIFWDGEWSLGAWFYGLPTMPWRHAMYIQRGTSRDIHALRRYANSTTYQQDLFRDPHSYQ
jgi:hypothetical protein